MTPPQDRSSPVAVLGYGSLLQVDSLRRTVPRLRRADLTPVRVDGFARVFHLVSLGRANPRGPLRAGQRLAVLDAVPRPGAQLGAVRFTLSTDDELAALDRREWCYDRVEGVPWRPFHPAAGPTAPADPRARLYSVSDPAVLRARDPELYAERIEPLAAEGLRSDRVRPIDDYLRLCLEGAFSWGRAFGHHFLQTTTLGDGRPLTTWGPALELTRRLGHEPPRPGSG